MVSGTFFLVSTLVQTSLTVHFADPQNVSPSISSTPIRSTSLIPQSSKHIWSHLANGTKKASCIRTSESQLNVASMAEKLNTDTFLCRSGCWENVLHFQRAIVQGDMIRALIQRYLWLCLGELSLTFKRGHTEKRSHVPIKAKHFLPNEMTKSYRLEI